MCATVHRAVPGAAGAAILAGSGATTISGAGSTAANRFHGGSGPNLIVAGDVSTSIQLGTGATTLVGGAGLALFAFVQGNASAVTIQRFDPARDYLSLMGFAPGAVATVLAGAHVSAGSETLTLSDGTSILLQGFTGLAAANFL